jgi:hypothetical protein
MPSLRSVLMCPESSSPASEAAVRDKIGETRVVGRNAVDAGHGLAVSRLYRARPPGLNNGRPSIAGAAPRWNIDTGGAA